MWLQDSQKLCEHNKKAVYVCVCACGRGFPLFTDHIAFPQAYYGINQNVFFLFSLTESKYKNITIF